MEPHTSVDANAPDDSSAGALDIFRGLAADKKHTKDGQLPKRRGPKPDSKPAMTRRQELNRQAQRTHRERKEMYIKALEQEVLRLKETFAQTSRERDACADENRRLRGLLASHGLSDLPTSPVHFYSAVGANTTATGTASSSGSVSGSYPGSYRGTSDSAGLSPPPPASGMQQQQQQQQQQHGSSAPSTEQQARAPPSQRGMAQLPSSRSLDYDQIGIEFVLTLERPCMDHMQYLMVRSHNPSGQPFHHPMENADDAAFEHMAGHALMATAPPLSHVMLRPHHSYPHQMPPDVDKATLVSLLQLSSHLPLDREGEITPIMAWSMIFAHERAAEFDAHDLERITMNLSGRVRCYGFGAVLEEFEVRDALAAIFAEKDNRIPALGHALAAQSIAVH